MINTVLIIYLFLYNSIVSNSLLHNNRLLNNKLILNQLNRNPFGRKYREQLDIQRNNSSNDLSNRQLMSRKYPITRPDFLDLIRNLNVRNITINNDNLNSEMHSSENGTTSEESGVGVPRVRIFLNKSHFLQSLGIKFDDEDINGGEGDGDYDGEGDGEEENSNKHPSQGYFDEDDQTGRRRYYDNPNTKSKNFQVIKNYNIRFKDVGGYHNVKEELLQCVDILSNYRKYLKYNVRIPKGLILEGPPGTGKTLLAKALAGEANCSFIPVSGSDFQEKYVGVGSSRIKELFALAKKNVPCIIFIDEIDALGRKRSSDGESSSTERDNTLNGLLVELDGFKNNSGIFLVAATNRIDLLDSALTRPGRIDKKIYIGLPDSATRESIINIHIKGKPYCDKIGIGELVEVTEGLSGAQIENLLNEAMLNALRFNKTSFCYKDFDFVMNKMMVGWQPNEHEFTSDIIDHIAIHEMGHAVVGLFSKHHSKVSKVVINLSSPKSPGYTVFEGSTSNIYIREALFEHLMILLAGRIAEEVFYDVSVTTGAINDFEEALKLAEKMIIYYGMGSNLIYPSFSEKYKELIDNEVVNLINEAYKCAEVIIQNSKELIYETSEELKKTKILKADTLNELIESKYKHLRNLKIEFE
jgi:cell division protease FtsH